ncbi:MAG: hypothetical protein L6V95_00520 [Candidatus Melainabacteria bacterium]|nr:MAG: hypothetical protein L6V95_00520 [Candidatus Melainabacteria bacterium]
MGAAQQAQQAQQPAAEEPVAAEQQALTEQQLNEQIQNLNKKLAKKGCGEFGKDVFQLLKSINNELSNGKLVVVTQDSGLLVEQFQIVRKETTSIPIPQRIIYTH